MLLTFYILPQMFLNWGCRSTVFQYIYFLELYLLVTLQISISNTEYDQLINYDQLWTKLPLKLVKSVPPIVAAKLLMH